jgi:hypothetical protein
MPIRQKKTTGWPDNVATRHLSVGGSHVDVITHRFQTRFTAAGRPYVSDEHRTVDGYVWHCHGCGAIGGANLFDEPYLPNEREKAIADANGHAETCRAMPRPEKADR